VPNDPYVTGLRLLAGRELSERRLADRLARRGFAPTEVRVAVERLRQSGAVDDGRAAQAFARSLARRGRGRLRVRRDVEAQGIDPDLARRAVDDVFADLDEDVHLTAVLMSRASSATPDRRELQRLYRFLLRRGFAPDAIHRALRRHSSTWDAE
jgi:SOS response regulatory protein OraA/RecX